MPKSFPRVAANCGKLLWGGCMTKVEQTMFSRRKIRISKELYDGLTAAAQEAGYSSTDEFIQHVLERSIAGQDKALSDEEQAARQLRGLGYLE